MSFVVPILRLPAVMHLSCVALGLFLACATVWSSQQPLPRALEGSLDLSSLDFSAEGAVPLQGQWRLSPGTLDPTKWAVKFIAVPSTWGDASSESLGLSRQGEGVYHLSVDVGPSPGHLALAMPAISGAYAVYLDGKPIFRQGTPGGPDKERARTGSAVVLLPKGIHGKHRLAIAVSNHVHHEGGLQYTPLLGRASDLLLAKERQDALAWLIFGAAIAIFMHYAVMSAISRDWGYGLYALVSLLLGLYLQVTQAYHHWLFPAISEAGRLQLEYGLLLAIAPAIYGFMRRLYPQEMPKVFGFATLILSCLGLAYVLANPSTVFTAQRNGFAFYVLGVMLVLQAGVILAAFRKRDAAILVVGSFLLTLLAASHDIWLSLDRVDDAMFTGWAFLIYTVGNAAALGAVASRTQQEVRDLGNDLARLNASLEERIQKRTQELVESERRLRDVSEAVGEFIWETDRRGVFTHASDRVRDLLGYRPEELYGRSIFSLLTAEVREDAAVLMDPEHGADGFRGAELEVLSKSGDRIALEVSAMPILANGTGKLVGWRGAAMDISDRKRTEQQLHELARTDSLTGLSNRRHFMERASELVSMCRRHDWPAAMVLIDVDRFKSVNDTYGHEAGDHVLKVVARVIQSATREVDVLSRYGGEEFALFLPNADLDTAVRVAERTRVSLDAATTEFEGVVIHVTASLGVAWADSGELDLRHLTVQADKALYAAKDHGRNRVQVYEPSIESDAA